jgi:phospholipid/cholesterol/gamma-HCH transport system substrate-binding protein
MSAQQEKGLELKVGSFVIIGLLFIAVMAVKFGQVGQGFKKFYTLTVELPNANGLIKNSDVLLAGARIGYVEDRPKISPSAGSVTINVKIAEDIKIPRDTKFQVNSSGLLGDRFVEIVTAPDFDPAKFDPKDPAQTWNAGDKVEGVKAGGLDLEALQNKAITLFDQLNKEVAQLTEVTDKINKGILSETNQQNISDTFANLKTTSERFADTSKNLTLVVQNAQGTVDAAKQTMTTANAAAGDLRGTLGDARKVLDSAKALITKAQTGDGLISTLLNNRQLSENLAALVVNLRQHGILFYKDRAKAGSAARTDAEENSAAQPTAPRQRQPQRLPRSF